MAWSTFSLGTRSAVTVLRMHVSRHGSIQVRQGKRLYSEGGSTPANGIFRKFTDQKIDFAKIQSALQPAKIQAALQPVVKQAVRGFNYVMRLDPDFRVIAVVVPTVLLTSYFLWTRQSKDIIRGSMNGPRASSAFLLPQPQTLSNAIVPEQLAEGVLIDGESEQGSQVEDPQLAILLENAETDSTVQEDGQVLLMESGEPVDQGEVQQGSFVDSNSMQTGNVGRTRGIQSDFGDEEISKSKKRRRRRSRAKRDEDDV